MMVLLVIGLLRKKRLKVSAMFCTLRTCRCPDHPDFDTGLGQVPFRPMVNRVVMVSSFSPLSIYNVSRSVYVVK